MRKPPLHLGPLSPNTAHLCIDMQRLFLPGTAWGSAWLPQIVPVVAEISRRFAGRNLFTRFIPPREPSDLPGMWQRYYARWFEMTRDRLDHGLIELVPELASFAPPAPLIDKVTYSAFGHPGLRRWLAAHHVDALVITGAETDVCILSTVLAAVEFGYRVTVVTDAICSSSDPGHDALLDLYSKRFSEQIDTVETAQLLDAWRDPA